MLTVQTSWEMSRLTDNQQFEVQLEMIMCRKHIANSNIGGADTAERKHQRKIDTYFEKYSRSEALQAIVSSIEQMMVK